MSCIKNQRIRISLSLVLVLTLMSSCGIQPGNIVEDNYDKASTGSVLLGLKGDNNEKVVLDENDSTKIESIISQENWEDETAECTNNIEFILKDNWFVYFHTDCGTFNDYNTNRHLSLEKSEKEEVNKIISKYLRISDFDD